MKKKKKKKIKKKKKKKKKRPRTAVVCITFAKYGARILLVKQKTLVIGY